MAYANAQINVPAQTLALLRVGSGNVTNIGMTSYRMISVHVGCGAG